MKKVIKSILVLILLVLIIPQVSAKEVTTTYTNYYFFLEPYKESEKDDVINNGTSNHTAFPPLVVGNKEIIGAKQITLMRECSDKENANGKGKDDCWTYSYFYDKYFSIESVTEPTSYNIDGDEGHISKVLEEGNKKYYSHGSYWGIDYDIYPYTTYKWIKYNDTGSSEINNYDKLKLACASISTSSTTIERKKQNGDKTFSLLDNNAINSQKDFYVGITRTFNNNSFENIDWEYDYNDNNNISKCPSDKITAINGKVYSPVLYKYEYTVTENKCDVDEPESNKLSCNGSSNILESNCEKITIKTDNDAVDVKINQKGIVSNILTPTTLYAGGGFKFGILYTNTISWDYVNSSGLSNSDKDNITKQMQNKLKSLQNIITDLTINIKFGENILDSNFFIKECSQEGSFTAGNTLTTTCIIYLPASEFEEYTGKVTYKIGDIGNGINNKYYTNLIDDENYSISGTLSELSVLNKQSSVSDSGTTGSWTGDWSAELTDCNINLYTIPITPTTITTTNNKGYIFLYRPIDINNPFPNRNAGINWFDWYSNIVNKQRLEDTYKNLNYVIELDNAMLSTIKKYNDGTNYFDFDTMEDDESTFLRKYFPNAKVGGS